MPAGFVRRSGNRCGHDPRDPRLELARRSKKPLVKRTHALLRRAYWDPRILPQLGKPRSEGRENALSVLCALVHHVEFASLRVLLPPSDTGDVAGVDRKRLRALTGMRLCRIDRGIRRLKETRILIPTKQPREQYAPGRFRGYAARPRIDARLWPQIGLGEQFDAEQAEAVIRQRKLRAQWAAAAAAALVKRGARRVLRQLPGEYLIPADQMQRFINVQWRLREQHREWSLDDVRAAAWREVRGS
jgi:hypothetical protein